MKDCKGFPSCTLKRKNIMIKEWGIAYTDNGSPPPSGKIMSWNGKRHKSLDKALEACDLDGWRGYVCEYPSGARSHAKCYDNKP